ncbi:hypothetical protein Mal4_07430 [Maioricimonas rarisocia]|uniref:RiboL-PSP-HEPN domain-containing protein n=1 Tax=Maioricimonas rarisocia TaxID=2528026 RepID=A0A517Z1U6_9PLAN|nr:hypothetical protein [Maioricimonas rarisocia]QDU36457.1 hypothetical protein Mal4_07430 [Maioricimonas rarisocia]
MFSSGAQNAELQPLSDRLTDNIARVHNLVSIYQKLAGSGAGRRSVGVTDVLRSAVVLLHASLEDFLRSLARVYLPNAAPHVIDSIPLKRSRGSGRGEKFLLGHLDEHRGKSVDEVIAESVDAYLERSNYNNSTEIARLLRNLGVDPKPLEHSFRHLDKNDAEAAPDCSSCGLHISNGPWPP